jgi:hypothetical protein
MSEKPTRPWFRFHLSTAVLAILVTGTFIGLNVRQHSKKDSLGCTYRSFGWPYPVDGFIYPGDNIRVASYYVTDNGKRPCMRVFKPGDEDEGSGIVYEIGWHPRNILSDVIIAVMAVSIAVVASELRIRMRRCG